MNSRSHSHSHDDEHGHTHSVIDPSIIASKKGLQVIKWSCVGLLITAFLQTAVVVFSGSVALLADTIHNFADATTALPLGIAFLLCRLKPTKKFPYGYGRVEDFAGIAVVFIILFSAIVTGYETIHRFFHPHLVTHLGAVIVASLIGFTGNEIIAIYRIKVGKEIKSAALIADGYHARTDGWTSLAVLVGAVGVYAGYPLADPIIGLSITIAILFIVWDSMKSVLLRALDGIEPSVTEEISHIVEHVPGVLDVSDVRARWMGHMLHAEINIAVKPTLSVTEGHAIASEVQHQLYHHMNYLSLAVIHVDPLEKSGEHFHKNICNC